MKKILKNIIPLTLIFLCMIITLSSCDKKDKDSETTTTLPPTTTSSTTQTTTTTNDPSKLNITGITFPGDTVTYDGSAHTISISGTLPTGVTVSYSSNSGTDAGTYHATATLSGNGYNTLTLSADLIINKADIKGVSFTGNTYTYNGTERVITITGTLPSGVSVSYASNKATDAGTYHATATVTGSNYNTLSLNADLVIYKADILGITLGDEKVEYDGLSHSINVVGNVPSEVTVLYTYNEQSVSSVIYAGVYTVKATLTSKNYNTLNLSATLTITSTEKQYYSASHGGNIYFQNPLDDDSLYVYNGSTISRVNRDCSQYLTSDGEALYYTSAGLLSSSIRSVSGTTVSTLLNAGGQYLVSDGTYLYYAVNNLVDINSKNGIYKYQLNSSDDPVRIVEGKASWLCVNGSTLYYAAGADNGILMKVNTSGGTATVVYDAKVSDVIYHNGYLYFNKITLTNCALYRFNVSSSSAVQMTIDAGKNLTVIGSYLFYINTDILTGAIFGEGIYKVALNAESSILSGTKIVDRKVSSLTSDTSGNLYYYIVDNKHFCRYDVSQSTQTDLMADFVPTSTSTPLGDVMFCEYGSEIYYLNPMDGGAIYKYNPANGARYKVIAASCSQFFFDGDTMYYSTYILTNYALWKVNLRDGSPAEKINTGRCANLIFDGNKIYYIKIGVTTNTLRSMNKDGSNDTEIYGGTNLHMLSLAKSGTKLFFCTNPAIGYKKLCYYDTAANKLTTITEGQQLIISGSIVFYFDQKANSLCKYDITTGGISTLVSNCSITSMAYYDGKVFFADEKDGQTGLYYVNQSGGSKVNVCSGAVSGLYSSSGGVYFMKLKVSYIAGYPYSEGTDGKIYCYSAGEIIAK